MSGCPKCHAPVVWIGTQGGQRIPIDAVMKKMILATDVKEQFPKIMEAYSNHLSTCKNLAGNSGSVNKQEPKAPQHPQGE